MMMVWYPLSPPDGIFPLAHMTLSWQSPFPRVRLWRVGWHAPIWSSAGSSYPSW